ncbi:MAG: putative DNA-binding domain-containing protein [Novosphingobium sp.]|nr:putative DNA-binding domain-containing protein [Novosphingobium sp.]
MTLAALQTRFHGAITGSGAPDDAGWDEAQRRGLAVYRNAYRMRLVETLRASFEKTWSWIGDDSFDTAAIHHLVAHPPASWTLDEAGRGFADTLVELFSGDPEVAELAALEWDMSQAFIGADAAAASAQDFAVATAAYTDEDWAAMRLDFVPGLAVRPVATDCAAIWHAIADGGPIPSDASLPAPRAVAVWRRGFQPCFRMLDDDEGESFALLRQGATFGSLCEMLIGLHGAEEGVRRAGSFITRWITDEIVAAIY